MAAAMLKKPLRVAVVGGGIGGAAAADALTQRGVAVRLFEQAPALAEVGAGVALQPSGIRMLRQLGLGEALMRLGARWARLMRPRMMPRARPSRSSRLSR